MREAVEGVVFAEGDDRDDARHQHVEDGTCRSCSNELFTMTSVRFGSLEMVAGSKIPKLYPDVVVLRVEGRRRRAAEVNGHRGDADDRRDDRQRPDGAVRREVRAVEETEVRGHASSSRPIA